MTPFAYLKVKALVVLRKASNASWWAVLAAFATGVAGRILWEITLLGWKLPAWVLHWVRGL